jgi:hypothetical protein
MTAATATDNGGGLHLAKIIELRSEAFAHVRHHSAMIQTIATGIEQLDAGLLAASERNLDEWQSLVTATAKLAAILGSEGGR